MGDGRITNAQLFTEITELRKIVTEFTSADGYGGRLNLLAKRVDEVEKQACKTEETVEGNGKDGLKKELYTLKHTVTIIIALGKWLLTPVLGVMAGLLIDMLFKH